MIKKIVSCSQGQELRTANRILEKSKDGFLLPSFLSHPNLVINSTEAHDLVCSTCVLHGYDKTPARILLRKIEEIRENADLGVMSV